MKRGAGFTIIELLITITIMVMLLILAVVNLRANQANARDEERATDVTVIAQQLESYYTSGSNDSMYAPSEYPPTTYMNSEAGVRAALRDVDPKVLRAPDVPDSSAVSLAVATDNSAAQSPTANAYIYQPLTSSGALCINSSDECRKFIIYYKLETNVSVQKVLSKNQ